MNLRAFVLFLLFGLFMGGCGKNGENEQIWFKPKKNASWNWQLNGSIKMDIDADIYIIDLFDTPKELVSKLHKNGKKVIAYFSAGSYESWREDAQLFPKEVLGDKMDGWDERWLDISNPKLHNIMSKRIKLAKEKGFDGVEADNVDGYKNKTGFKLKAKDQLSYNIFLSNEAHKNGLSIALKNDIDQIKELESYFDFAINEQCHEFNECDIYKIFISSNKPVFNAEYKYDNMKEICKQSAKLGIDTLFLPLELDGSFRKECN